MVISYWIFLLFFFSIESRATAKGIDIYHYLMNSTHYDKRVRPVTNTNDPVNMTFGLSLHEIIDLDEKSQLLALRITIRESWFDSSLSWEPSDFKGIKKIAVDTKKIWIPDVVLYNNAGEGFGDGIDRVDAIIQHDGLVRLRIPSILQSSCKVHLQKYPFDEQVCPIKFGSWMFDETQIALNIESPSADLSSFVPSIEWELLGMSGEFHSKMYNCCANAFHDIEYHLKIKRRSLFHAMYLIIPCVVISLLTLLMFLLPPECNERMTVGMAILVGLSFFFLLVAENMPATSEGVPLIGIYYTVTLLEISGAFFMTCVVLRLHHHNPVHGEIPKWAKVYILGTTARFLRFHFAGKTNAPQINMQPRNSKDSEATNIPTSSRKEKENDDTNLVHRGCSRKNSKNFTTNKYEKTCEEADKIIAENIEKQEVLEKRQEEWKMVALVFNSIFMWIYIIAIVISFVILLAPPLFVM